VNCPQCSAELAANAKFCSKCGAVTAAERVSSRSGRFIPARIYSRTLLAASAAIVGVITLAMLGVALPACDSTQSTIVSEQITAADGGTVSIDGDSVVRIPPGALSEDTTVAITRASEENPAPSELEDAVPVGDAFNIDLGGARLSQPVTLEIAYDPDLLPEGSPQEAVFLAFYDEEKNEWVPVDSTLDLDRHVVTVETDHLSWWNPFSWGLSELWDKMRRKIEGLLGSVGLPVADIPQCGENPRYMTVGFNDSLLACIESTENERQALLKLANNRTYAVLIHLPPTVELRWASPGSLSDAAAAFLEEKLGREAVYIPPAGHAEFLLHFDDAGDIQLSSAPSDTTIALDILLTIFSMLGADPENVIDGMECLFEIMVPDTPEPRTAGDLLDVVKECAGVALKGRAGILWTAMRTFVTIGAATGELVVDRTFGNDEGEVTVTYSPPPPTPTPTPTPTTFTDPFAYCAAVGTVDKEVRWDDPSASEAGLGLLDDRWDGPAMPDVIKERLGGAPPFGSFVWRCFEGKVMACTVAAHNWCGTADTSLQPSTGTMDTCRNSGMFVGQDPFLKANIYVWDCQGGRVIMVGQKELSVDTRGFLAENWRQLEP
jgi:hypothetical protein